MEIITTKTEMQKKALQLQRAGKKVGFVPTMGYLHKGHLKLARRSVLDNDVTVMSIFVNPLQFGPNEDFDTYPRDHERDLLLAKKNGIDILFLPEQNDIYDRELSLHVSVSKRADVLCGKSRQGHFDGVVMVLMKLFHIVSPNKVYFGLKDAQQTAIVDGLITSLDFPIELVAVETDREDDGLARSSRNVYLTEHERKQASQLYQSLLKAKEAIESGERNPKIIVSLVTEHLHLHTSSIIDYVEVLSYPELLELNRIHGKIIIAIATHFTKARLIDNIILDISE